MRIYKYPFDVKDEISIKMPKGAKVLSVAMQNGGPNLWALVYPDAETETRRFFLVGTGHPAAHVAYLPFIGTFQMMSGSLVFHLFDATPTEVGKE